MKLFLYGLGLFALMSCGQTKNATVEKAEPTNTTPITMDIIKVKATIGTPVDEESTPVKINAVEVRGNLLYIDVEYSGGCEDHRFELIGSNMIAKSMPPIRGIQLVHYDNGDTCKKLIKSKLEINIEDLAYQKEKGSEIYLTLPNWKEKIKYTYQ